MLCESPGGNSGTTSSALSSPTPTAGKTFRYKRVLPLTVLIMNIAVSIGGVSNKTSLIVSSLALIVSELVLVATKSRTVLALLATVCTRTLPRQRLRNTKVALIRKNKRMTTGTIAIKPRVSSGDIFSYYSMSVIS